MQLQINTFAQKLFQSALFSEHICHYRVESDSNVGWYGAIQL